MTTIKPKSKLLVDLKNVDPKKNRPETKKLALDRSELQERADL
jgi:hypothetical protein